MSSGVYLIGLSDLIGAITANDEALRAGAIEAVTEIVDETYDDSQDLVPYDAVTKHTGDYVHLRDSGTKAVTVEGDTIEGSITYGTDHSEYVEHGTTKMLARPYLNPSFEANKAKLETKLRGLIK